MSHGPKQGKAKAFDSDMSHVPAIDRSYDIPYIAGYSEDGKTIYIDKDLPQFLLHKRKKIAVAPFLIIHEALEKALIDVANMKYQDAHAIATHVENASVAAAGIPINVYEDFYKPYKKSEAEKIAAVPRDLDLTPYEDEKDTKTLKMIKSAYATSTKSKGPHRKGR